MYHVNGMSHPFFATITWAKSGPIHSSELFRIRSLVNSTTTCIQPRLTSSKHEIVDCDWTQYPLYSHTMRSFNFDYRVDPVGQYCSTLIGVGFILRGFLRSWCVKEAAPLLAKGLLSGELSLYRQCSGMNNKQLKDSMRFRQVIKLRSFAIAGCIIGGFSGLVQIKNLNRFV